MRKTRRPNNRALFSVYVWLSHSLDFYKNNILFIKEYALSSEQLIHVSRSSPTLIIKASLATLNRIKSDTRCLGLSPFISQRLEKTSEVILSQMGESFGEALPEGESGLGVSFGMISVEREIFSTASPQLKRAESEGRISTLPYPIPPIPSLHPSVVLCEIIGEELVIGKKIYRGMAPMASVTFSTSETSLDVLSAIERLLTLGIRVINLSAGITGDGEYTAFDRQIDRLIEENDLLLVVPSGNRLTVASPGAAFNTLTVGNLQTKSSPDTTLLPPWNTRCTDASACSGFRTDISYPHKPDLSAPGTFIPYVTPTGDIYSGNIGTSFACPWVCGIALRLLALSPSLSAIELKAIIALSSTRDTVSGEFNESLSGETLARVRSGFGCVNVGLAEEVVKRGSVTSLVTSGLDREEYTVKKNEKISVAICFNKNTERQGEDIILRLASPLGSVAVCNRKNQNLHVAEYIAPFETQIDVTLEGSSDVLCARVVFITS